MHSRKGAALAAAMALAAGLPAQAQEAAPAEATAAVTYLADTASPFGTVEVANDEAASVKMPELGFTPVEGDAANYDKYYYFHRRDTDFATAYADVRECDGYARGLQSGITYAEVPYPYAGTLGGAIGGAIGNAMAMAIFGSAEKRRLRRVNMRACMSFKGYARYGLSKDLWVAFNFEEGLSGVGEADRDRCLKQQALVASSAVPQGKVLGL